MPLYFMRHGQVSGNARQVWVGRRDEALTERGRIEVEAVAERFAEVRIDHIFTSPLQRALNTARIIAERQKTPPVFLIREALQERDFGYFEGLRKTLENRHRLDTDPSVESLCSVQQRLQPVLREAASLTGNVLLVSHSVVFRCLVQGLGCKAKPPRDELVNAEWVILDCDVTGLC